MFNEQKKTEKKGPNHVAIIMDGNGRYAEHLGLPRIKGHEEGMENVRRITIAANRLNIKYLTLYAFSTENWSRPKSEVSFLMKLPGLFMNKFLPELMKENVKVETIGHFDKLPLHTKKAVSHAKEKTKNNTGLTLIFALNYGARSEIVDAVKEIVKDAESDKISHSDIDESLINNYLYTKDYPDPELLIRTSGECRVSNFLLWQISYSEFHFTDTYWPELTTEEFNSIINEYRTRERRFGGLKEDKLNED